MLVLFYYYYHSKDTTLEASSTTDQHECFADSTKAKARLDTVSTVKSLYYCMFAAIVWVCALALFS